MLFQKRFHAGIADGSITRTFRVWSQPQVTVGDEYEVGKVGRLRVDAVHKVPLATITDADIEAAGFASREKMTKYLRRASRQPFDDDTTVYAVTFHYDGADSASDSPPVAEQPTEQPEESFSIDEDERHALSPWMLAVLSRIAEQPGVADADLTKQLGRGQPALENDLRRLRSLDLVSDEESGYKPSPKGEAYLASELDGGTVPD